MFASKTIRECVARAPLLGRRGANWRNSFRRWCALGVIVAGLLGIGSSSAHAAGLEVRYASPVYYVDYHPYHGIRHSWHHRHWAWNSPYGYRDPFDYSPGYFGFYPSPFWEYPW